MEATQMIESHGWRSSLGLSALVAAMVAVTPSTGRANGGHHDGDGGHHGDGCRAVRGGFSSVAVFPPECTSPVGLCTSGRLSGTLQGATYAFTMNSLNAVPEPEAQFVSFFAGISTVTTRSGRVLRGVDTGAMNLMPPGTEGSGKFSTLLSFIDGGGGFLHIRGTLDLATGNAEGDYEGEVCSP
jgi:hypothetical protein